MRNDNQDGLGCAVAVGICLLLIFALLSVHIKKLRARVDVLEHRVKMLELAK